MYILASFVLLIYALIDIPIRYKRQTYHNLEISVPTEEIENIIEKKLYYNWRKGLYEISILMLVFVLVLLYTYHELPKYNLYGSEDEHQILFFVVSIVIFSLNLLRTIFLLSYKVVIKEDTLYYRNLLHEQKIPLNSIKDVTLTPLHYIISTDTHFYLTFIPSSIKHGDVIYRQLLANAKRESAYEK